VDRIDNYVGQDLDAVKLHLQTLFASSRPLVSVKEPPIFVFDKAAAGTILEQKPLPETEISGPTALELVVSRGPEKAQVVLPELRNLSFAAALVQIEKTNLPAVFTMKAPEGKEKPGVVVAQDPAAGTSVPVGTRIALTLTMPAPEKDMVAGVFERELPEYPYPLRTVLEAIKPTGERLTILKVNHPGGRFSAPYVLPENSLLVLSVLDREIARHEVKSQ
jgi:beta-lactam-binding protein with PASTA domain